MNECKTSNNIKNYERVKSYYNRFIKRNIDYFKNSLMAFETKTKDFREHQEGIVKFKDFNSEYYV